MTIIVRHDCVKYGSGTPGSALDCAPCWEALQQRAFPEDPDLPKLIVRNSRETISREVVRRTGEEFHYTTAEIEPDEGGRGGVWSVSCVCGWNRSAHYARSSGALTALRLARLKGAEHEDNPDKRCAYCGHPERERACTFCQHGSRQ